MSRTYKGRYPVKNPSKYVGDHTKVTYRSSWELRYARYCDISSKVLEWNSEEYVIPYFLATDGKMHRYYVDFYVKVLEGSGKISKHLIEIKPNKERKPPKHNKNKRRFLTETLTYIKNQAKWKAATIFAHERGMSFYVLDEFDLGIKSRGKKNKCH